MILQVEAVKQAGARPTDGHFTAVSSCLKEDTNWGSSAKAHLLSPTNLI